ncbi:hypothetical protein [Photobacterium kasasachensis]
MPDPDYMEIEKESINIEIIPAAGHSMVWENPEGLAMAIVAAINLTK